MVYTHVKSSSETGASIPIFWGEGGEILSGCKLT